MDKKENLHTLEENNKEKVEGSANINKAKNSRAKKLFMKYFFMVVAGVFYSISIVFFNRPNEIVAGGVSGLATLINILQPAWPIGTLVIVINIPILLVTWKKEGTIFILDSLLTVATLGLITDGMTALSQLPAINSYVPLTSDKLLASMYSGVSQGIALGLYLKYRVSSGGTEMLGRVLQSKIKSLSIPVVIAILDGMVVVAGAIVLHNLENLLYVLIIIFISTKVSDIVIMGLGKSKLCYIITNYPEEVSEAVMHTMKRGVTFIEGTGMYTKQKHGMLMVCIKKNQIAQLKSMLKHIDSHSFVIVSDASEVYGEGFTTI